MSRTEFAISTVALIALSIIAQALQAKNMEAQGYIITGRMGSTDQEAQEGYFAIDRETMIVVKPNSEFHNYLRSRNGSQVRLTIEPITSTE